MHTSIMIAQVSLIKHIALFWMQRVRLGSLHRGFWEDKLPRIPATVAASIGSG